MLENTFGDMWETALRSLLRDILLLGKKGTTRKTWSCSWSSLEGHPKWNEPDDISLFEMSEGDTLRIGESLYNAKLHKRRNDYLCQKNRLQDYCQSCHLAITHSKSTEILVMPGNTPYVIQAVRAIAGYEMEISSHNIRSWALKFEHSLWKNCRNCAIQCHYRKLPYCFRVS